MNKVDTSWRALIVRCLLLAGLAVSFPASAGLIQGVVTGVAPGATLDVSRNGEIVAKLTVQSGQLYSISLDTGRYTVRCPSKTVVIFALSGPVVQNISC